MPRNRPAPNGTTGAYDLWRREHALLVPRDTLPVGFPD